MPLFVIDEAGARDGSGLYQVRGVEKCEEAAVVSNVG